MVTTTVVLTATQLTQLRKLSPFTTDTHSPAGFKSVLFSAAHVRNIAANAYNKMLFNTITKAQHADKHKQRLLAVVQEDLVKKKVGKKATMLMIFISSK